MWPGQQRAGRSSDHAGVLCEARWARAGARWSARTGLRPVAVGIAAGLALAFVASRVLASEPYGIAAWEPVTMAAAGITILLAAGLAVFTPAHRLSRVDPASALRGEP